MCPRGSTAAAVGMDWGWDAAAQSTRVWTKHLCEVHVCVRPNARVLGFEAQARSMYGNLAAALVEEGASLSDVVAEKVFLQDVETRAAALLRVRDEVLRAGGAPAAAPALSVVGQPPVVPGRLCELQARALVAAPGAAFASRGMEGLRPGASGRVVASGGSRHAFIAGVTGGSPGDGRGFAEQAAAMFVEAETSLGRAGLSFHDVARTWIYLKDIDRDYAALNAVRRQFFASRRIEPPPASTGIRGTPHPAGRACAMDLVAVAGRARPRLAPIHAAGMNEAPTYGSDFSRGVRVDLGDRSVVYVSGTASIDDEGRVVGVGDVAAQADRMLRNVEDLLAEQGAGFRNLVSAITYLKRPEDADAFRRACARRGLPDSLPNSIVAADVCRPEWLCEMEAIAILA